MAGTWKFNRDDFRLCVPRRVLRDDEERLEWIQGMKICDYTLNHREELMAPEGPDDDE